MSKHSDDDDVDIDPVVMSADERIRREALRQLNSIDIEDDEARMEPLTTAHRTHLHAADPTGESLVVPDQQEN